MNRCHICQDARRADVDHLLAAGRSGRSVAAEFGLSPDSMKRHARSHLAPQERPPDERPEADQLDELLASLRVRALDGRDASLIREYRLALGKQAERNAERPAYNVLVDPQWVRLRTVLLEALQPFPEAHRAMRDALHAADALDD